MGAYAVTLKTVAAATVTAATTAADVLERPGAAEDFEDGEGGGGDGDGDGGGGGDGGEGGTLQSAKPHT